MFFLPTIEFGRRLCVCVCVRELRVLAAVIRDARAACVVASALLSSMLTSIRHNIIIIKERSEDEDADDDDDDNLDKLDKHWTSCAQFVSTISTRVSRAANRWSGSIVVFWISEMRCPKGWALKYNIVYCEEISLLSSASSLSLSLALFVCIAKRERQIYAIIAFSHLLPPNIYPSIFPSLSSVQRPPHLCNLIAYRYAWKFRSCRLL